MFLSEKENTNDTSGSQPSSGTLDEEISTNESLGRKLACSNTRTPTLITDMHAMFKDPIVCRQENQEIAVVRKGHPSNAEALQVVKHEK